MQRLGLVVRRCRPRAGVAIFLGLLIALIGPPIANATPSVFSYTGPAVPIPDGADLTGTRPGSPASVPITVSGLDVSLSDIDFRIDGTACSTTTGATTVGIDHSFVLDLRISLTSPAGTTILLLSDSGGGGNNLCQVVLDDQGGGRSMRSTLSADAPFTGTWTPEEPLAAFNGENPNGTWTVTVQDVYSQDSGNIRAVSLLISANVVPTLTGSASADTTLGGTPLTDTVTVAGRKDPQPGATVDFQLFGPADPTCTGTPVFTSTVTHPVSDGPVSSTAYRPTVAGTYRWVASYSGDANNAPIAGACGDAAQSVTVSEAPPVITPKPPKPVTEPTPPAPVDAAPPAALTPPRTTPAPKRKRAKVCTSRRRLTLHLIRRKGFRVNLRGARITRVTLAGDRGKRIKQRSTASRATINLRGLPKGRFTVRIKVRLRTGKHKTFVRHYRTCSAPARVRIAG